MDHIYLVRLDQRVQEEEEMDEADAAAQHLFLIFEGKHTSTCHGCSTSPSKLHRCKACKSAVYCGQECQLKHWNAGGHRHLCKTLIGARTKGGKGGRDDGKEEEKEETLKKRVKKAVSKKKSLVEEGKRRVLAGEFFEEEEDEMPNLDPETRERLELVKAAHRKRKQEEMEELQDEDVINVDRIEASLKRRDIEYRSMIALIGDPGAPMISVISRVPSAIARFAAIASLEDVARWSVVSRAWNQTFAQSDLFWYHFLLSHGHEDVVSKKFNTNVRYRAIAFQTLAGASGWWRRDNIRPSDRMVYELLGIIRHSQGGSEVILDTYNPIDLVAASMTSRSFNRWIGSDQQLWRRIDARNRGLLDADGDDLFSDDDADENTDYRASVLAYPMPVIAGAKAKIFQTAIRIYTDQNIVPRWKRHSKAWYRWNQPYGTEYWDLKLTWADFARHRTLGDIVEYYAPDSFSRGIDGDWSSHEANYNLTEGAWYFEGDGEPDSYAGEFPWPDGDQINDELSNFEGNFMMKLVKSGMLVIHCLQKGWGVDMDMIWPKGLVPENYDKVSRWGAKSFFSPSDWESMSLKKRAKFRGVPGFRYEIDDADGHDFYEIMEKEWPKAWVYQGEPLFQTHDDWEVLVVCGDEDDEDAALGTTVGHVIPGLNIWRDNKKMLKAAIQSQIEEIDDNSSYGTLTYLAETGHRLNITFTIKRK